MAYRIINGIFAGLILVVFLYAAVFSAEKNNYPIPSFFEFTTGKTSPSAGLSRSFSEMVRLDFDAAREYNREGPRIFLFFFIQLFMRGLVAFVIRMKWLRHSTLVAADASISVLLFTVCFRSYLAFWRFFP